MNVDLYLANKSFMESHQKPEVVRQGKDTKVKNKGNTSNRHPRGNFDNSWMKYWMAFSEKLSGIVCSIDGEPIWTEEDDKSCDLCRKRNRQAELIYYPNSCKEGGAYNGRKAHGAHVVYKGKTYIVPMCASENTSLKDEEIEITLKAGTIMVEEIDPIIEVNK